MLRLGPSCSLLSGSPWPCHPPILLSALLTSSYAISAINVHMLWETRSGVSLDAPLLRPPEG